MPGRLPEEVIMDEFQREHDLTMSRIKHELDVLSCMPQLTDYEQRAEIQARVDRGELLEINGRWFERVDYFPFGYIGYNPKGE